MIAYDQSALPAIGSPDVQEFKGSYLSAYTLILNAESDAINAHGSSPQVLENKALAKQRIVSARVVGGFLIHLYRKRRILGDGPASRVVTEVLSGSIPSGKVVYGVGKNLRDRLYACTYQSTMHLCVS